MHSSVCLAKVYAFAYRLLRFPKLLAQCYSSGVVARDGSERVAAFRKREYPNNQINWELVDGWLKS